MHGSLLYVFSNTEVPTKNDGTYFVSWSSLESQLPVGHPVLFKFLANYPEFVIVCCLDFCRFLIGGLMCISQTEIKAFNPI